MTTAVANPPDQGFRQFLVYSIIMHGSLAVVIVVSAYIQYHGKPWGGVGGELGGAKVSLVSSAGIPMPKESVVTESKAVDPTKGLHKEEPPKPSAPKTDATKIPKFEKEKPLPPSRPSRTLENKTPVHDNDVPYGKEGNPDLPTGYSQTPGGGSRGVTVQGQGAAEFAARYAWYVEAAKRKVEPNWNLLFLDPAIRNSRTLHCVISFTIKRDGNITPPRVAQSSGNSSWDYSGVRAIQSSAPFAPLPPDWTGGDVAVLWDFPDRDVP